MDTLNFSNSKVLTVGDVMLDKYYFGNVERISPEAPVPVVNINREESRLGGAANVANNIVSLGGQAVLCGAIGNDSWGEEIEQMTEAKQIRTHLLRTPQPTTTKIRVIGGRQQIVRLDHEEKIALSTSEKNELRTAVAGMLSDCNVLVISDYNKGLISEDFCRTIIFEARQQQKRVIIDPKGKHWEKYAGADIITPNIKELSEVMGYHIPNNDGDIEIAASKIFSKYQLTSLLVTRSEKGMSLINTHSYLHIPTHSEEIFDVSGAGDTVVATLSICLASGMDIFSAIKTANVAAGIVVKKIGTATLSIKDLVWGVYNP